jgi:hypothetical protein
VLGWFKDVFYNSTGDENSCDLEIELKNDGALDIHEDANIIARLQVYEVLVRLTLNECDQVVHRVKLFKWEFFFLTCVVGWTNASFVLPKNNVKTLCAMCHEHHFHMMNGVHSYGCSSMIHS